MLSPLPRGTLALRAASDTHAIGAALGELLRPGDVVALFGPLAAGKTTLARGLLAALGLETEAPSPSFPIVIAYAPPELRVPVWHVDLYRVRDPRELDELGLDDARDDAALLVEWPERMGGGLWSDALRLTLARDGGDGRRLTWEVPPSWEARWPPPRP